MEPVKKRPRLNDLTIEARGVSFKSDSSLEQKAAIFRLNDDCFDAIFQWLFAEEFPALSKTCVRLHNLVKIYFARIYPQKRIEMQRSSYRIAIQKYDGLQEIIPNITFHGTHRQRRLNWHAQRLIDDFDLIDYYARSDCHQSPKFLRFENMALVRKEIKPLENALKNVETIEFKNCEPDYPYDNILRHCDNLKSLSVRLCSFQWNEWVWLMRRYPKLESFEMQSNIDVFHTELHKFFKNNPQLKRVSWRLRFGTQLSMMLNVMQSAIEMEELFLTIGDACEFRPIYGNLLNLSQSKAFKRLSLEFCSAEAKDIFIDNLNNLACIDKLYALHLSNIDIDKDLPNNIDVLANLKELHLSNFPNSEHFARAIAMVTPSLELLVVRNSWYFTPSVVGFIQPFIEYLPQLKKIVLAHNVWATINQRLAELNSLRQKLNEASTVFIWLKTPNNELKEKPKIVGKTLIRMIPISDEYDHFSI